MGILLSPVLEVRSNTWISRWFKYGSAFYARDHVLVPHPDRVICEFALAPVHDRIPDASVAVSFYYMSGVPERGEVFSTRVLPFGRVAALSLSGMATGLPSVRFNRLYGFWANLRAVKMLPPIVHLASMAEASLLQRDIVPVHAACVLSSKSAHLLMALPDTGKSYSTLSLIREGLGFGGEDIVFVRNGEVFPAPFTTTVRKSLALRPHEQLLRSVWAGFDRKYTAFEAASISWRPLAASYRLGNLYILARSHRSMLRTIQNRHEILRHIVMLNRLELEYTRDRVLTTLLALNSALPSMDELLARETAGLESLLRAAVEVFYVEADRPERFPELIRQTLGGASRT